MASSLAPTGHALLTPEARRRFEFRQVAFLGALALELVAFALWESDAARGFVVAAALGGLSCLAIMAWSARPVIRLPRHSHAILALAGAIVAIGVYGLAVAAMRGNRTYYVAADAYHWYAEFLLGVLLGTWALRSLKPERLVRVVAVGALFLGALGLGIHVLGTLGFTVGGGRPVSGLDLWRLELGRGFPEIPLIIVTAALLHRRRWDRGSRMVLWLAFALLFLNLGLVLKRTMWLSYGAALLVLVAPRRALPMGAVLLTLLGIGGGIALVVFPRETGAILSSAARTLTYNPDYTIQETLRERMLQLGGLIPYLERNPLGYGFGAEFRTFVPQLGDVGPVHYIHNLYLFYALQLGLPGLLMLGLAAASFATLIWRRLGAAAEWDWALRASLASLMALGVNGLTLLSTHTLFAGFALALGVVAVRALPATALARYAAARKRTAGARRARRRRWLAPLGAT